MERRFPAGNNGSRPADRPAVRYRVAYKAAISQLETRVLEPAVYEVDLQSPALSGGYSHLLKRDGSMEISSPVSLPSAAGIYRRVVISIFHRRRNRATAT